MSSHSLRAFGVGTSIGLAMTLSVLATNAMAQGTQPAPAPKPPVPLKVDVVISRFQADKKIASAPFTLWVNAHAMGRGGGTSLRMGVDVPVGKRTEMIPTESGAPPRSTAEKPEYRFIGTSVDSSAVQTEDGRFAVYVSLQDSSIYVGDDRSAIKMSDVLAFRSFTMSNTLSLRSGQTAEYSSATDRLSGEVVKVEVTVNVVK